MQVTDLVIEVRNAAMQRVGQILPIDLVGFTAVLRKNNVGNWSIPLPSGHAMADALRSPGAGIIVTGPSGVILSGPTTSAKLTQSQENPKGTWEISGVDDSIILAERLAYPTPGSSDVAAQIKEFDARTGVASTVMHAYVSANIGATATAARKIANLTAAADPGLGSSVSASARFDQLGELLANIASIDGLVFDVRQVGTNLEFVVFAPTDRSATVRMDIDNNRLTQAQYVYRAPVMTRSIVGGQGEGTQRIFQEVTNTDSLAAETSWGRRIEAFKDQRNAVEDAELIQAGLEELVIKGRTIEGVSVTPTNDLTMAYGSDWGLGDKVSIVAGTTTITRTVTEVGLLISEDGVRIGATVGEPAAEESFGSTQNATIDNSARISYLERNEPSVEYVRQYVKNDQGTTITKGQAVYGAGANGTNFLVKLAKADTEPTSSKTLGLLSQDLDANGFGYVVTEGVLGGLNTSAATAGDTVWLSQTTAGALIFGTANRPSGTSTPPGHMVFIGWVIRSNSNNGEIYVKPQNGFELSELHDLAITSPANNNLLAYDSASGFWKNETAAQANLVDLSSNQTIGGTKTFTSNIVAPNVVYTSGDQTIGGFKTFSSRILLPNQPAFYAHGPTSYITLANLGDLAFSVVEYNVGGHFNPANYRFTAPVTGSYYFSFSLFMQTQAGRVSIKVNNTSKFGNQLAMSSVICWSGVLPLNAGDYVTVGSWQSGFSGMSCYGEHSSFTGHLIG